MHGGRCNYYFGQIIRKFSRRDESLVTFAALDRLCLSRAVNALRHASFFPLR